LFDSEYSALIIRVIGVQDSRWLHSNPNELCQNPIVDSRFRLYWLKVISYARNYVLHLIKILWPTSLTTDLTNSKITKNTSETNFMK
jgi:hypothetical protein